VNDSKVRQEIRTLSREIHTATRIAKGLRARGQIEQAEFQENKALRLHARRQKLNEP
jgi:hypothetical protein